MGLGKGDRTQSREDEQERNGASGTELVEQHADRELHHGSAEKNSGGQAGKLAGSEPEFGAQVWRDHRRR